MEHIYTNYTHPYGQKKMIICSPQVSGLNMLSGQLLINTLGRYPEQAGAPGSNPLALPLTHPYTVVSYILTF